MNNEDFTNVMHPGFSFILQALKLAHAKYTCLISTKTPQISFTREAVYKVTFSKLHGCHCTLFKPLHSGINVTRPNGCVVLECLSSHLRVYCVINVLALYDGKWKNKLYLKLIKELSMIFVSGLIVTLAFRVRLN